ncbi:hypothetical protein EDB19DRAFT_1984357 [Suillus lakei]|nr:hypothetical protein EDB19DRAFT_1984357 [Suillus lakei]
MPQSPREPSGLCIPCTKPGYNRWFRNRSGYTQHVNVKHSAFLTPPCSPSLGLAPDIDLEYIGPTDFGDTGPMDDEGPLQSTAEFVGPGDRLYRNYHPFLSARPCDPAGAFLPPGTPPPPLTEKSLDDWTPYGSHVEFELANYLFTRNQTPAHSIDQLLNIWAASLVQAGSKFTLFSDHHDLYKTIDNTPLGDVKWQSFSVKYTGTIPDEGALPWMEDSHDVWFHDPHDMNLQPYREFATENDERQWKDFMSGDWSWADKISEDPDTHGSTFVPVILGSDKTTVAVATGQNDYYPLYASIGNVQNNVHRAHRGAVAVIGFLAMPKTTKEHAETPGFQNFRRQLFHSLLSFILKNLKPAMTRPEVARFGDGHYRCVIYGLGPYIADYEEQVLLAYALIEECDPGTLKSEYGLVGELVPFMNNFPHADIHELLAPDILHQLIKGAYKDHLVEIAAVPLFPGLHRFPQGCHFKQWTGNDSKALMKVYLPTIEGYVPVDVVRAFRALLEFCYLVRHNVITEKSLSEIEDALTHFHTYRKVFKTTRVVTTFSLPRQHSMSHYSKHIKAVKEPWRRSSRYKALGQMLLTNQHLDKLAASRVDFCVHGMLAGTCLSAVLTSLDRGPAIHSAQTDAEEPHTNLDSQEPSMPKSASMPDADVTTDSEDIDAPTSVLAHVKLARTSQGRKQAQSVDALTNELDIPYLVDLVSQFLVGQLYPDMDPAEVPDSLMDCPCFNGKIWVFNSTVSVFFALSNLSGIGGMKCEYICVSPKWRSGHACKNCVYYPCVVVRWFNRVGNTPDDDTGMWMVESSSVDHHAHFAVIHVDTIFHSAHLIPVYGTNMLPSVIKSHHVLDIFTLFYVNKYADHHAFEIAC